MGLAAAAIVAVVGGVTSAVIASKNKAKAQKAIEAYNRQELKTVTEDLSVSRLSSDLQREELARTTATGIGALQAGGSRSLIGGIGKLQAGANLQSRKIAAGVEAEQRELDRLMAQDRARVQQMMEQRERADLAGLGQQVAVSKQNMMKGISGAAQGVVSGISGFTGGSGGFGASQATASPINFEQYGQLPDFNTNMGMNTTGLNPYGGTFGSNPFLG